MVGEIVGRSGRSLGKSERDLLFKNADILDDREKSILKELYQALWKGFFYCAAEGHQFTSPLRIKETFGLSLEENYPSGSRTFLKVATAYWTFKLSIRPLFRDHYDLVVAHLLGSFEQEFASVFFPTSGPVSAPEHLREQAQRELIKESGAPINIEDFVRGNPILKRSRGGGCLSSVLLWVSLAVLAALVILFVVWF